MEGNLLDTLEMLSFLDPYAATAVLTLPPFYS